MADLTNLWRGRLKLVVENLVEGEREHREIASLAEQIEADYHGRFLVELIQNANDQAVGSEIDDVSVLIVRTDEALAVLNQGRPFDDEGVRDITSIGLSNKQPDTCLGNKGIGFKAVFEISRSPEIYSAPDLGSSFIDAGGTRFRLDTDPLSDSPHRGRAREIVTEILADRETDLTPAGVIEEAERAAPFKYPLEVPQGKLEDRLSTLSLSSEDASSFQTLVYLPLIEGEVRAVDRALDALVDERGASVLFLNEVNRIEIRDRSHGIWCELGRRQERAAERLDGGARLSKVRTWKSRGKIDAAVEQSVDSASRTETTWWRTSSEFGTRSDEGSGTQGNEREALRKAARDLPGEAWKDLDSAPVAVALPRGGPEASPGAPLGADGLFCIGLPTEMRTGTPVWLHSHFHGNISRTEIDLETQQYNELLFKEGVRLLRSMLDHLRNADNLGDRRLVTLAMEPGVGPLQKALHAGADNVRSKRVVLAADGETYLRPIEISLPLPDDVQMLRWLLPEGEPADDYGFKLPEEALLTSGRELLEELTKKQNPGEESRGLFLKRQESGQSLIERGAQIHRSEGPGFWEPFLRWLHDRFTAEELNDQRILPVGSSELRAPEDGIFFAPDPRRGGPDIFERLHAEAALEDLPFVDQRAVPARKDDGKYTELATKLAPESGPQLVRRPEGLDLINHAVTPYLKKALSRTVDDAAALRGLRLALLLTDQISLERRRRIRREELRVPVGDPESADNWIAPTEAYLGPGWVDGETDNLLQEAYGEDGRRLLPWTRFKDLVKGAEDREAWGRRMQALGVDAAPKLRTAEGNRPAPLKSSSKGLRRDESVGSPLPGLGDVWSDYLEEIRNRPTRTSSGQAFDVDDIVWIDGLEQAESRRPVVQLMLLHARRYRDETETVLGRVKNARNRDRTTVPTMWVHALRSSSWPVIPSTQGLVPPSDAWIVQAPSRTRSDTSFRILPVVSERYKSADADVLLREIGASSLEEADIGDLVRALHYLAGHLDDLSTEDLRDAKVLAKDLYRDIQTKLGEDEATNQFDAIVDHPVPLLRDDLNAVNLTQVDTLFLNDDPVRARFVPGLEDAPNIPTRAGRTYGRLLDELRRVLGDDRVQRTSTAEVETGFEPLDERVPPLLPDELANLPSDRNIELDLAALVTYRGPTTLDPHAERFQQLWDRFDRTRVQRGRFPDSATDLDAFYDSQGSGTPLLQISSEVDSTGVLAATWQVFGEGYRDVIELYASKISEGGATKDFFKKRKVGKEEFRRLRDVAEGAAEAELERAKALGLVLARRRNPDLSGELFETEWDPSALLAGDPLLSDDSVESLRALGLAMQRHDEHRIAEVLADADVSVEEWQSARRELAYEPWRFRASAEVFEDEREELAAELMALAARRASIDPNHCQDLVSDLREAEPPPALLYALPSLEDCREAALTAALSLTEEDGLLVRRLRAEREAGDSLVPEDIPDREVAEYRQTSQRLRSRRANEFLTDVLDVAEALAPTKEEELDRSEISDEPRISQLSEGWLASHYALAPVLRDKLYERVPETAAALVEPGAFRKRIPKSELWRKFPELESETQGRPKSQPSFDVFGESWREDEIKKDLTAASEGSIGAKMRHRASGEIDLRKMANRDRETISPQEATSGPSRSPRGGGTGSERSETQRARELNGLLGEIFVFEQLRQSLPGFDSTCWVSENRSYYGHGDPGSDAEGHDFLYTDIQGILAQNEGAVCEIEVKSSSSAEPTEFNLTQTEMDRARACHQDENREYVILWVANVREGPVVKDVLRDPIDLWERGLVDIRSRGGRKVKVAPPKSNRSED